MKSKATKAKHQKPPPTEEVNALLTLYNARRYAEAEYKLRSLLGLYPDFGFGWKLMGSILQMQGKDALPAFKKTAQLLPDDAQAYYNLGVVLRSAGRLDEAAASYRRVIALRPNFAEAHGNLGNILYELGQFDAALTSYRKSLEFDPKNVGVILRVSHICMINGEMKEAEMGIKKALGIEPNNLEARFMLTGVRKTKAGDENLVALEAIDEAAQNRQIPMSNQAVIQLKFALGKCFDDIGDYDRAFLHYIAGNKLKRATFQYDAEKTAQYFNNVISAFDRETIERLQGSGDSSQLPIFVVGMPRSGTTLTEQIIASHPDVHGAGELDALSIIGSRKIAGTEAIFPNNISDLDQADIRSWGADYVAELRRHAPHARRITDKAPTNYFAIGLIYLMLPRAKIIHVTRNPMDTCLSCFMQLFSSGQQQTYNLSELGRYYVNYIQLMEHWRNVLPAGSVLEVQYEDIVADQELQARRIIDFCGLEWSDDCIDFYKHNRPVATTSMTQVRQPIYKSSVERWRRYEKFLGPLQEALGDLARK